MTRHYHAASISVRNPTADDIDEIIALLHREYPNEDPYERAQIASQINNLPEGQFIVELDGKIVGYASSFLIDEETAMGPHTWNGITGHGSAANHNPDGEWLYGLEVCVDRKHRRLRLGQRLYDARRQMVEGEYYKGIVFGGRMPNYGRHLKTYPDPLDSSMRFARRR